MFKQTVEGWSRENYEEALFDAMAKADKVMRGQRNAHVAIKVLNQPEEGLYHAILEISTEVMGLHDDLNIIGQFKETSRAHTLNFRIMLKQEHDHLQHVITDHFAKVRKGPVVAPVPDFILVPLTDADIDNKEIEKNLRRNAAHFEPE